MKVWISRTRPGGDRQAAELRRAGHQAVVAPVIDIEPLEAAPPDGPFDAVVFLSEHAVRLGLGPLETAPWFPGTRVLSVGARTAQVLRGRGVAAESPAEPTSEGLLSMPALRRPRGRRALLVTGRDGRAVLSRTLTERGAEVERFECYRRVAVQRLEAPVLDCEVVIAASAEGLERVAALWRQGGGSPAVPVLVPSARVAALGVELGLSNLHDCGGADSDAWLRGLAQVQSAGTS